MVWLLQLLPLHTQREGKLMKILTPMSVPSGRQFLKQSAAKEHALLEMPSYKGSQICLHVYHTIEGQATASL